MTEGITQHHLPGPMAAVRARLLTMNLIADHQQGRGYTKKGTRAGQVPATTYRTVKNILSIYDGFLDRTFGTNSYLLLKS